MFFLLGCNHTVYNILHFLSSSFYNKYFQISINIFVNFADILENGGLLLECGTSQKEEKQDC